MGAVIKDGAGRLLLVKRGHEPGKGLWSIPGGRIEPGETDEEAVVREVREETGLDVTPGRLVGSVRRPAGPRRPDGSGEAAQFEIRDYAAEVTGGTARAGDDADDVVWAGPDELAALPLTAGLLDTLRSWGAM